MRFVVTFQSTSDASGIHSLRAVLKIARRRFGLVAIDAREVPDDGAPDTVPDTKVSPAR
jgi:hypothetical protein